MTTAAATRRPLLSPRATDLIYRYAALAIIVAVIVFFAVANENFLTVKNLTDILRSVSISAFLALGVTFSLVVDGFDVSIGSVASLATMAAAAAMVVYRQELAMAILVPLLLGCAVGLFNAFLIVKLGLPDLLAMLFVVNGIQLTFAGGYSIYPGTAFNGQPTSGIMLPSFLSIGQGSVAGIPVAVILLLAVVLVAHLFLTRTTIGRNMYLVAATPRRRTTSGSPLAGCERWPTSSPGCWRRWAGSCWRAGSVQGRCRRARRC